MTGETLSAVLRAPLLDFGQREVWVGLAENDRELVPRQRAIMWGEVLIDPAELRFAIIERCTITDIILSDSEDSEPWRRVPLKQSETFEGEDGWYMLRRPKPEDVR